MHLTQPQRVLWSPNVQKLVKAGIFTSDMQLTRLGVKVFQRIMLEVHEERVLAIADEITKEAEKESAKQTK